MLNIDSIQRAARRTLGQLRKLAFQKSIWQPCTMEILSLKSCPLIPIDTEYMWFEVMNGRKYGLIGDERPGYREGIAPDKLLCRQCSMFIVLFQQFLTAESSLWVIIWISVIKMSVFVAAFFYNSILTIFLGHFIQGAF